MPYHVCNKMKIRGRFDFGNDYGIDAGRFQLDGCQQAKLY